MRLHNLVLASGLVSLVPLVATADVYTVGPGGCMYTDVQAAVNAAAAHAGPDEVRISVGSGYVNQAIVVNDSFINLSGGFASCTDSMPTSRTVLSGAGGEARAVLSIEMAGIGDTSASLVQLDHLDLIDGDNVGHGGGGLLIDGSGTVSISHSRIANNRAAYGGGIYISGVGDQNTALLVGEGVQIEGNSTSLNGAGIYISSAYLRIGGLDTVVRNNHAASNGALNAVNNGILSPSGSDASGGGLYLLGFSTSPASADIRSGGEGGDGILSGNSAELGGGIYAWGFSTLRLYSTDAARPVSIDHNTASLGGGVMVVGADARVTMWEGRLTANIAAFGGGAVVARDGGKFTMHPAGLAGAPAPAGTIACPSSDPCNLVADNVAGTVATPAAGAIALVMNNDSDAQSDAVFWSAHLFGNAGASLFADRCSSAVCANPMNVELKNSRLTGNDAPRMVEMSYITRFVCDLCTIADNGAQGGPMFDTNGMLALARSILWEPGREVIADGAHTPWSMSAHDLQLHDRADFPDHLFPASANIEVGDPRFVAPGAGDFRLGVNSPALDRSVVNGDPAFDLDGHPRSVDQPAVPDRFGPVDLGAYERVDDGQSSEVIFSNGFD